MELVGLLIEGGLEVEVKIQEGVEGKMEMGRSGSFDR